MSKDSVKPEIRFKEFEDSWEQIEVRKVAPLQRGFDLPKSKMIEGPYPVVFSNGIGGRNTEYKVKGPGVTTGRSGTIGNVTYVDEDYWPHNTSLWVTNFFENYPLYIFYLYQYMDLSKFGTGSGVPTLNRNDVHDYKVALPNPTEQTLISHFLNYIDNTLALHQREHTKLTNFKQSMLQKMFPKEGETVPEVRFEGFEGKWKIKRLADIANSYNNQRIPITAIDRTHGNTPYYGANGIQDYVEGYTHKGEYVLLAEDGANDLSDYPVRYVKGEIWVNNHAHVLQAMASISDNKFLSYIFKSIDMAQYLVGGSRYKLNASTLQSIELKTPNIKEQEKIGEYFYKLDQNIQSKQAALTKLKQFKQAMLDKMFV